MIFGSSIAGIYAILTLAQDDDHVFAGAVLMAPLSRIDVLGRMWKWALPDDPAEREKALVERSPIEQAHKIHAPVRIFHGGRDQMSDVEDIREIQRRIETAGGECTLTVYEKDIHLLGGHRDEIAAETLEFLRRFE